MASKIMATNIPFHTFRHMLEGNKLGRHTLKKGLAGDAGRRQLRLILLETVLHWHGKALQQHIPADLWNTTDGPLKD